jgi:hypothetical protein
VVADSSETPTIYQNNLAMSNTADMTGGKPIAVLLQSISGVSAINPLVAFYGIDGRKRQVLFFYFFPDTTHTTDTHTENNNKNKIIISIYNRRPYC